MSKKKTSKKAARKPKAVKLPNKLSDLLELAVRDLTAVEKLKSYKVNMADWHVVPNESFSGKCEVCFAGAVLARTCKLNKLTDDGYQFVFSRGKALEGKMVALDLLRLGDIHQAIREAHGLGAMYDAIGKGISETVSVTQYSTRNKDRFKSQMRKLAKDLRAAGF